MNLSHDMKSTIVNFSSSDLLSDDAQQ